MTLKLDYLYHKGIYEEELRKYSPGNSVLLAALRTIRRLQSRQKEHIFGELNETQLEQSFNEQVFCNVFGYDSQFMVASGQFHVLPKVYASSQFNDLSLGYRDGSNQSTFITKATIELKGPDHGLEDRAVPQAFKYATSNSTVEWVLVSNFKEIFLFDKRDRAKGIHFDLARISDANGVKRILFPIAMGAFFRLDGNIGRLEKIRRRARALP